MTPLLLLACALVPPAEHQAALDPDGDGSAWPEDCDDTDASIWPGADELCNGRDDNCDGVTDEGCGWQQLSLEEAAATTLSSESSAGVEVPATVVDLGDVDNDGTADVASGQVGIEEVWLLYGTDAAELGRSDAFTTVSLAATEATRFGASMAVVESDGCEHGLALAIGAPDAGAASASSFARQGEVYLFEDVFGGYSVLSDPLLEGGQTGAGLGAAVAWIPGPDSGWLAAGAPDYGDGGGVLLQWEPCSPLKPAQAALVSSQEGEAAGSSLATVDLNSDGYKEVVVGAPESEVDGRAQSGRVYVVSGADAGDVVDLDDSDVVIMGSTAGGNLGQAVAVGDVDDDGEDDLVLGAPGIDDGGAAFVLTSLGLNNEGDIDSLNHVRIAGPTGATGLGFGSGALVHDLDGDGAADLTLTGCGTCGGEIVERTGRVDLAGAASDRHVHRRAARRRRRRRTGPGPGRSGRRTVHHLHRSPWPGPRHQPGGRGWHLGLAALGPGPIDGAMSGTGPLSPPATARTG